jgi:hypothetical protein
MGLQARLHGIDAEVPETITRAKPRDLEHKEQVVFVTWCKMQNGNYRDAKTIFAIPNGGHRDIRVAVKLKSEGVMSGVPDLFLPEPVGYHGLFVEMKSEKGTLSESQKDEKTILEDRGYKVVVCYSAEEAIEAVKEYLDGRH